MRKHHFEEAYQCDEKIGCIKDGGVLNSEIHLLAIRDTIQEVIKMTLQPISRYNQIETWDTEA